MSWSDQLIAKGVLPDSLLRAGIRRQLQNKLNLLEKAAARDSLWETKWIAPSYSFEPRFTIP